MKWLFSAAVAVCFTAGGLLVGCKTAEFTSRESALRILNKVSEEERTRAEQFNKIASHQAVSAVMVDSVSFNFFAEVPEELSMRLKLLGVNQAIFTYFPGMIEDDEYLAVMHKYADALADAGINTQIALRLSDCVWQRSNNFLMRKVFSSKENRVKVLAEAYRSFNNEKSARGRFSGVLLDFNVEFFTVGNPAAPAGQLYSWSPLAYGTGGDNDSLVKMGFGIMNEIKTHFQVQTLGVKVDGEIIDAAQKNQLSCGSLEEFIGSANFVIVKINADTSAAFVAGMAPFLAAAGKDNPNKVGLLLPLALHSENNVPGLRRRSFKQFCVGLEAVIKGCGEYPSFRGVLLNSFNGLEDIWEK